MRSPSDKKAASLSLLLAAVALPSCVSPKFERAWEAAAHEPVAPSAVVTSGAGGFRAAGRQATSAPLAARWEGRWRSSKHNFSGRLRAIVQQPADGKARLFFEAGWHGFTTAYPVSLAARPVGAGYELSGEHNLRSWVGGGLYNYKGTLDKGQFSMEYDSDYDFGTFLLTPVPPAKSRD